MTSRLSSLLVRDGLIGVSRMEYVYQRQVIHGGALDTILLELDLIEDGRLQQYLSLATGLPLANKTIAEADDALLSACNKDLAKKYDVVPVHVGDDGLQVVVCEPVDIDKLEGLAAQLDMKVSSMVVPEYRFKVSFATIFGEELEERFTKLAEKAPSVTEAIQTPPPPVYDAPKVTFRVDTPPIPDIHPFVSEQDPSDAPALDAVPEPIEQTTTQPADTSERVRGKRAPEEKPKRRQTLEMSVLPKEDPSATQNAPAAEVDVAQAETIPVQAKMPVAEASVPDSAPISIHEEVTKPVDPQTVAKLAQGINDTSSLTPEEARHFLSISEDRDEIFTILLRAMRSKARYTALFTLKGKTANGRMALSKAGLENEEIKTISIPLDLSSRFQQVFESKAFSIGPLNTEEDAVIEALTQLGGGAVPKSMLLLPVVMRDRVIAIAVAHNKGKGISVGRVTELLPLGRSTADAVSRLLAKMRAAKTQPAKAAPEAASENTAADSTTMPVADPQMVTLFEAIQSDDAQTSSAAIAEALQSVDKAIAHLDFCFPGKLLKNRHDEPKRLPPAEYGPILSLVTQIGPKCGCALSEKMRDADREVRYYATLCAAEIHPEDVINQFVERLFDGDEAIRAMAVEALPNYPKEALHTALDFARRALHSEDNERLKLAAQGLTKLGDVSAIPDFIDAHSRGGEAAEISQRALFLLTNQDLGTSNRKWRSWWEKNEQGNRIDWMLDGLASKNADARKNAVETLRALTGEFFGYGHDLPKKQREKSRKKWLAWWKDANT